MPFVRETPFFQIEISGEKSQKQRKSGSWFPFGSAKSSSTDTINDLVDYLTRIWRSLRTYYVEESEFQVNELFRFRPRQQTSFRYYLCTDVSRQVLLELIRIIGYT